MRERKFQIFGPDWMRFKYSTLKFTLEKITLKLDLKRDLFGYLAQMFAFFRFPYQVKSFVWTRGHDLNLGTRVTFL
jgi:hypothetical protein